MTGALAGQNILVTGGSGGIGAAIVKRLAKEGARSVIHYERNRERAEALLAEIFGRGWIVQGDLARDDGPAALWRNALGLCGRIHGLVNNAGVRTEIRLDASDEAWREAWRREFQINLFAVADLTREAVGHFKKEDGGRIINMASRAGQRGYAAEALPYGASKAALVNLTKSIARSFGADGIVAIAVAPGWVRTAMADEYVGKFGKDAAVADIPIGELAEPEEIAELVAFASRPSQRSLNGATLDVNGGSYIR